MEKVGFGAWVAAARLRTVVYALMPVIVAASIGWKYEPWGNGSAAGYCTVSTGGKKAVFNADCNRDLLVRWCLYVALFVVIVVAAQIAVNFARDYSDGVRTIDPARMYDIYQTPAKGASAPNSTPENLTATRKVDPSAVLFASGIAALVALCASFILSFWTMEFGLLISTVILLGLGWLYAGGSHPYGYAGFGEPMIFILYGFVATGSAEVFLGPVSMPWLSVSAAVTSGSYAMLAMLIQNLRTIEADRKDEKRTLVVRMGVKGSLVLISAVAALGFASTLCSVLTMGSNPTDLGLWWILIGVVLLGLAVHSALIVTNSARARFRKALNLTLPAALIAGLAYVLVAVLG